jgi:hypothetical protein
MKTGRGYLGRLAARAATPTVTPQPVLFHTEIAPPALNPAALPPVPQEIVLAPPPLADAASVLAPVPQEIALAPPPLADAASVLAPVTGALPQSRPFGGAAASAAPPDAAQEPGAPLPRANMEHRRSVPFTRPAAPWDKSALRGSDSSDRSSSRPIPRAAAASVALPSGEPSQTARVAQAAAPPRQPATLTKPAIKPDTLRSAHRPAAIPLAEEPAPPRPPEQPPRKSEAPRDSPARREPIEAELSPSLEALERITGLWQARAARQPSRESAAAPAPTVTIGTLEVRIAAPPTPVPAPPPALASPLAPLARGFRAFGLRQS